MVIALHGKAQSGKDTIADYLIENLTFKRMKFAQPIRDVCTVLFGWDDDWMETHKEEIDPYWGISYRDFAVYFGTEIIQFAIGEFLPNFKKVVGRKYFVKRILRDWSENMRNENVIITDYRFPHESEAVTAMSGIGISVTSNNPNQPVIKHESEDHYSELLADYNHFNDFTKGIEYNCLEFIKLLTHICDERNIKL